MAPSQDKLRSTAMPTARASKPAAHAARQQHGPRHKPAQRRSQPQQHVVPHTRTGAKQRVAKTMGITEAAHKRFWNAGIGLGPSLLDHTSFGGYTFVSARTKFTVTSSTTASVFVLVPWTATPLAAMEFRMDMNAVAPVPVTARKFNQYAFLPSAMRPARMSVNLMATSSITNTSGSIQVLSVDSPVITRWDLPATEGSVCNITGNTIVGLAGMCDDSPDTKEYPLSELLKTKTCTSLPSSYIKYNSYYDAISLSGSTALTGGDIQNLFVGNDSLEAIYPGAVSSWFGPHFLEDVPAMRTLVFRIPATSVSTTVAFEVYRQDACRYPANSLGMAFQRVHPPTPPATVDLLHKTIEAFSRVPSVLSDAATVANTIGNVAGGIARLTRW